MKLEVKNTENQCRKEKVQALLMVVYWARVCNLFSKGFLATYNQLNLPIKIVQNIKNILNLKYLLDCFVIEKLIFHPLKKI